MWLQKEIASLDKKKQEHAAAATRSATFAAGKMHCFINHLRQANLLSSSFVSLMETWHEMDACHNTACKLKQVQLDKQFVETQVDVTADTLKDNEAELAAVLAQYIHSSRGSSRSNIAAAAPALAAASRR